MQKITIMGFMAADAELKTSGKGTNYVTFRMAVNAKRNGQETTTWYRVMSPNPQHQGGIFPYLKKGSMVIVTGDLNISKSNGNDGREYTNIDVIADSIQFGPTSKKEGSTQPNNPVTPTSVPQDAVVSCGTIPQAQPHYQTTVQTSTYAQAPTPIVATDDVDDLPF